jgi:hypothetical protein
MPLGRAILLLCCGLTIIQVDLYCSADSHRTKQEKNEDKEAQARGQRTSEGRETETRRTARADNQLSGDSCERNIAQKTGAVKRNKTRQKNTCWPNTTDNPH